MTNEEYFINWAKEYEESVNALTERIDQLREEKKTAKVSELMVLDERIRVLSQMKTNCAESMKALLCRADHERRKAAAV